MAIDNDDNDETHAHTEFLGEKFEDHLDREDDKNDRVYRLELMKRWGSGTSKVLVLKSSDLTPPGTRALPSRLAHLRAPHAARLRVGLKCYHDAGGDDYEGDKVLEVTGVDEVIALA